MILMTYYTKNSIQQEKITDLHDLFRFEQINHQSKHA